MQHLFVEWPLALKLKEARFGEPCLGVYRDKVLYPHLAYDSESWEYDYQFAATVDVDDDVLAPIYQQVFDWLEGKGFDIRLYRVILDNQKFYDGEVCQDLTGKLLFSLTKNNESLYETKKQAWDRAIEEALKILKEKDGK